MMVFQIETTIPGRDEGVHDETDMSIHPSNQYNKQQRKVGIKMEQGSNIRTGEHIYSQQSSNEIPEKTNVANVIHERIDGQPVSFSSKADGEVPRDVDEHVTIANGAVKCVTRADSTPSEENINFIECSSVSGRPNINVSSEMDDCIENLDAVEPVWGSVGDKGKQKAVESSINTGIHTNEVCGDTTTRVEMGHNVDDRCTKKDQKVVVDTDSTNGDINHSGNMREGLDGDEAACLPNTAEDVLSENSQIEERTEGNLLKPKPLLTAPCDQSIQRSFSMRRVAQGYHHGKEKLGHRQEDLTGNVTYKKTPSQELMDAIQLGLRYSISSLSSRETDDILMQDFSESIVVDFPTVGSSYTPLHNGSPFTFTTYAPRAFRYFRNIFGILPEDFLVSLCVDSLKELSNPGASGSLFYLSADDNFIIKTVQKKEATFLRNLLPGYFLNITQNNRTLLPKFFGLFNYKSILGRNIRILVMNNILPTKFVYHERFDLKGSTFRRVASPSERKKRSPTLKDLDFISLHSTGILLSEETYNAFARTLRRDVRVLTSFGIMDYSLLVGVHFLSDNSARALHQSTHRDSNVHTHADAQSDMHMDANPETQEDVHAHTHSDKQSGMRTEVDRDLSTDPSVLSPYSKEKYKIEEGRSTDTETPIQASISTSNDGTILRADNANAEQGHGQLSRAHKYKFSSMAETLSMHQAQEGDLGEGLLGFTTTGKPLLLFIGVIDMLQNYALTKKLEHGFKALVYNPLTVSVCNPEYYEDRFLSFSLDFAFRPISNEQLRSLAIHFSNNPATSLFRLHRLLLLQETQYEGADDTDENRDDTGPDCERDMHEIHFGTPHSDDNIKVLAKQRNFSSNLSQGNCCPLSKTSGSTLCTYEDGSTCVDIAGHMGANEHSEHNCDTVGLEGMYPTHEKPQSLQFLPGIHIGESPLVDAVNAEMRTNSLRLPSSLYPSAPGPTAYYDESVYKRKQSPHGVGNIDTCTVSEPLSTRPSIDMQRERGNLFDPSSSRRSRSYGGDLSTIAQNGTLSSSRAGSVKSYSNINASHDTRINRNLSASMVDAHRIQDGKFGKGRRHSSLFRAGSNRSISRGRSDETKLVRVDSLERFLSVKRISQIGSQFGLSPGSSDQSELRISGSLSSTYEEDARDRIDPGTRVDTNTYFDGLHDHHTDTCIQQRVPAVPSNHVTLSPKVTHSSISSVERSCSLTPSDKSASPTIDE
eukprot:CFRG1663T1